MQTAAIPIGGAVPPIDISIRSIIADYGLLVYGAIVEAFTWRGVEGAMAPSTQNPTSAGFFATPTAW